MHQRCSKNDMFFYRLGSMDEQLDKNKHRGDSYSTKRRRIRESANASWNLVVSECIQGTEDRHDVNSCEYGSQASYATATCSYQQPEERHEKWDIASDSDDDSTGTTTYHDSELNFEDSSCESEADAGCHFQDDSTPIATKIAEWKVKHNISQSALQDLLSILRPSHPELPRDARTLMQTPRSYHIKELSGDGKYVHFGIVSGIESLNLSNIVSHHLKLQFNIDGLPLYKSSSVEFWPILCSVRDTGTEPFIVGVYSGKKKPVNLQDFLGEFVSDLGQCVHDGVMIANGRKFTVSIDCFICDAPARAYVKNVKYHSGYYGCDKCMQQGDYLEGRMTFPNVAAPLRTDVSIDNRPI